MIRRLTPALLALLVAAPLAAQTTEGYMMRVDRSTSATHPADVEEVTVTPSANGFQVATGPAVTLWQPEQTARGNYTLRGRFTLLEPSSHRNF